MCFEVLLLFQLIFFIARHMTRDIPVDFHLVFYSRGLIVLYLIDRRFHSVLSYSATFAIAIQSCKVSSPFQSIPVSLHRLPLFDCTRTQKRIRFPISAKLGHMLDTNR
jgi:hypothetical protein